MYETTEQIANLEIRVGNTPINTSTTPPNSGNAICRTAATGATGSGAPITIACDTAGPLTGRYVSIQSLGVTNYITLCEVKVSD